MRPPAPPAPAPLVGPQPVEQLFAPLISNGTLVRIWWLDRQTQMWYFYDPDPLFGPFNTLETVLPGEIVVIKVTRLQQFRGEQVQVGWNYISIK